MAGAFTTVKMAPADHTALQALLFFLAGKITEEVFRGALAAQGRKVENIPRDALVSALADQLIGAVS